MENRDKLKESAQELKKGLELLSRDRKVVLPHNKAFDLVDELREQVDKILSIAESA
ncbi:MAG TPA: hypothetical protein QF379_00025 [SAR86 cluster bacterium]|nr:hypothetical protein [SAR86 cluster bacterium]HJM59253.1 hypothetical protein [SAR86 cluster bacterium]|tara:strand:- start:2869 stop:3036 length:168 start_codon:yes stop_codon:yes gene_type:complete